MSLFLDYALVEEPEGGNKLVLRNVCSFMQALENLR
jgi:hypothetical protein